MKAKSSMAVFILAAIMLFSCSKDASVLDIFIPNLSNQWVSDRNTNFFFTSDNPDKNESTFFGNEQDPGTGDTFQLTGKYKNYDVEFTFTEGPETGVTYTGKFIKNSNPLRMEMKAPGNKKVTITQNL
ncbi:hypothetical protein [Mucilaginibacter sp.]|uniref:hypothetical protein n=1 Tax=Mucilaginibacter sp. TaxID=1882438 RepID=UPI002609052D|nr:hypothetical protein [Mucilaginibacter sp.]MDB5126982.1 hypothetical protein [Mucilaginibacter sp.]